MVEITRTDILEVVARAWGRPETEKMIMNPILAEIIADEIIIFLDGHNIRVVE